MVSRSPLVLIVDDHQDSLAMYSFALLAMGFEPILAETAEDGFELACRFRPDVIVADITRPGLSGLDLTRRLRSDERSKGAGIIVLSGRAFGAVMQEAEAAGCDRFLLKPCLPAALATEIREVLSARRQTV